MPLQFLRMNFQKILFVVGVILFIGCISSCEDDKKPSKSLKSSASKLNFKSPRSGAQFSWGDTIQFDISIKDGELKTPEKVSLFINGSLINEELGGEMKFAFPSSEGSGGSVKIKGVVKFTDGTTSRRRIGIKIRSKTPPSKMKYQLLNTFPHDTKSYTQGLLYDSQEELLFEGTGNYTESRLLKIKVGETQSVKEISMGDEYFGEGITLRNDTIFQLTYKRKKGFYYDREFKKLGEFTYPGEGWGLTHNNEHLIMSDGSANLFFIDPQTFKIERTIQVFSDKGPLHNINELEYVNGIIYANIYTTEYIAKIDARSGQLLALINMEGLLDDIEIIEDIDVLNGIAFNSHFQSFYITGKYWPNLFEVRFVDDM